MHVHVPCVHVNTVTPMWNIRSWCAAAKIRLHSAEDTDGVPLGDRRRGGAAFGTRRCEQLQTSPSSSDPDLFFQPLATLAT